MDRPVQEHWRVRAVGGRRRPQRLQRRLQGVIGHSIRAVAAELFGQEVSEADGFADVLDIVLDAMRGAAARGVLRKPGSDERLMRLWAGLVADRVGLSSQL